mgnify:CR=1 FL=1
MKGKIENTIPQRQFENIKITYDYETKAEYYLAIEQAIEDCLRLHNIVGRKAKLIEEQNINNSIRKSDAWKIGTKLETPNDT